MSELATSIILMIANWVVPFVLGLLFRKRVGRAIVNFKRWLFNDITTIEIVSIRMYTLEETPAEIQEFTRKTYDDASVKIPNMQLRDIFDNGMRIVVPTFGNLKLTLSRISEQETLEDGEEQPETIKMTLQPESPTRLGTREVRFLNDFSQTAEVLFSTAEALITTNKRIKQDYTLLELTRLGRFVEEKMFEIDDKDLGTHVHATRDKLTLSVSPTSQIAKATKKYFLV